jgi:hypothetical protein
VKNKKLQNFLKGGLDDIGKQLLNQAGDAVVGAAKEFIGQIINETFIKKEAREGKKILPSIQNMKVVSSSTRNILNVTIVYAALFRKK